MVEYCREKTAALGVVKPLQLDVASEVDVQLFIEKEGTVDHILASFLLNWIVDQETGLRNIFNLLKPGGDFLAVHFQSNLTFRMNIEMQKSEQWGGYFTNLDHHVPKSTTENHSEVEHRHLFTNCGFVDTVVHLKRSRLTLAPRMFVPLIQSVHVQIINFPKDRIDEYMKDYSSAIGWGAGI